jgi:hypothetical protein
MTLGLSQSIDLGDIVHDIAAGKKSDRTRRVPPAAMAAYAFFAAVLVSASSSAPTPLYQYYAKLMHLPPVLVTLVFGVYAVALLGALLIFGGLSDFVGRRPVILAALILNAIAMLLFVFANDYAWRGDIRYKPHVRGDTQQHKYFYRPRDRFSRLVSADGFCTEPASACLRNSLRLDMHHDFCALVHA